MIKKEVDKSSLKVYGMENCPACKVAKVMLDDQNIPYEYIDLEDDDFHQNRLVNVVGDFTVPKFEYGDTILNYSMKTMEKIIDDFK